MEKARKHFRMILSIGIALAVLAALFFRLYPNPGATEKIRLGVAMTPMSLLVFVAQERGFFAKHGLDISFKEYGAGVLAAAGLLKDEVDAATAAEFLLVRHNLEGADLKTIGSISRISDCQLIARKDRGISSAADLSGKKIATVKGTALEFFFETFLTVRRISLPSVSIENLTPNETVDALKLGTVDAMVGFSPYTYRARRMMGSGVLSWPLQEGQYYYFLIISRSDFFQSRPLTARKLLSALLEAEKFVADRKIEAQAIMMKRLGLSEEDASATWSQQSYDVRADQHLLKLMEAEAKWLLKRKGGNQQMPNYLRFIDWQPLEKIKPEAVGLIH